MKAVTPTTQSRPVMKPPRWSYLPPRCATLDSDGRFMGLWSDGLGAGWKMHSGRWSIWKYELPQAVAGRGKFTPAEMKQKINDALAVADTFSSVAARRQIQALAMPVPAVSAGVNAGRNGVANPADSISLRVGWPAQRLLRQVTREIGA